MLAEKECMFPMLLQLPSTAIFPTDHFPSSGNVSLPLEMWTAHTNNKLPTKEQFCKTRDERCLAEIQKSCTQPFQLFKTAFDFFYTTHPSTSRALKLKQTAEEGLVPYKNLQRNEKAKRSARNCGVIPQLPPVCLPSASPSTAPATPKSARPVPPQAPQREDDKDEALGDEPLPLNGQ